MNVTLFILAGLIIVGPLLIVRGAGGSGWTAGEKFGTGRFEGGERLPLTEFRWPVAIVTVFMCAPPVFAGLSVLLDGWRHGWPGGVPWSWDLRSVGTLAAAVVVFVALLRLARVFQVLPALFGTIEIDPESILIPRLGRVVRFTPGEVRVWLYRNAPDCYMCVLIHPFGRTLCAVNHEGAVRMAAWAAGRPGSD